MGAKVDKFRLRVGAARKPVFQKRKSADDQQWIQYMDELEAAVAEKERWKILHKVKKYTTRGVVKIATLKAVIEELGGVVSGEEEDCGCP